MAKRNFTASRLVLAGAVAGAFVVGCKQSSTGDDNSVTNGSTTNIVVTNEPGMKDVATNAWQKTKEGASNAWNAVKSGTTNAWDSLKGSAQSTSDYTYDKKDAFVATAKADLADADAKIKELSDKVASSSDAVKADAQAKLADLQSKRAVMDQKLEAARNSTEADWNRVKASFQGGYDDLKASLKQAGQWLNDKLSS